MDFCRSRLLFGIRILIGVGLATSFQGAAQAQASSSASQAHPPQKTRNAESILDAGSVRAGVYLNAAFGFTYKIPAGWVLRTEEMNVEPGDDATTNGRSAPDGTTPSASPRTGEGGCARAGVCARVLLAAFSRPPEARAEDVNASILIAAESVAAYPGLKEAAQYFGPVTEVAKARGFAVVEDPYEFALGAKTVVRGDFQKDVGTRMMLQSTLVMLARGYAVSFTFIGGTADEVEQLIAGLSFGAAAKAAR